MYKFMCEIPKLKRHSEAVIVFQLSERSNWVQNTLSFAFFNSVTYILLFLNIFVCVKMYVVVFYILLLYVVDK